MPIVHKCLAQIIHDVDEGAHEEEELKTKKKNSKNSKYQQDDEDAPPKLSGFSGTIQAALRKLNFHKRPDLRLDIDTMMEINNKFPQLLVPAFDIQVQLINTYGGRPWWDFMVSRALHIILQIA